MAGFVQEPCLFVVQGAPDARRARRHLEVLDPRLSQRVDDRVHERRHGPGNARLAHALRSERIQLGRHRVVDKLDALHEAGARHRVVHEAARKKLPALAVVNGELMQDLPGALREPALHLAFHDLVVQYVAGVVAGDVRDDLGVAGLGLDLDFGDVAAVRKASAELVLIGEVEAPPCASDNGDRAVRALDAVAALRELDVGLRRL